MIENVKNFVENQIESFGNFKYKIEKDSEYVYVVFSEILAVDVEKELTFKTIEDVLYLHSTTYGWKPVEKGANNKYFWIEILEKKL